LSKTSDEREQLGDSTGPPATPPGVEPPPYHKEDEKQPGLLAVLRETVVLVALAVLLAVVFKTFLVAAFYIPSGSMESTLNISDRVLVEKVSYRFGDIEHGDVIVFVHDEPGVEVPRPSNPVVGFFSSLGQAIANYGRIFKTLHILRLADEIYIEEIRRHGLYDDIWQAFAVILPVKTVGVMGDGRTYDFVVGLRAVTSTDGMTADFYPFDMKFLGETATRIINEVKGVNRVVYDVTSKPPGTIEWE